MNWAGWVLVALVLVRFMGFMHRAFKGQKATIPDGETGVYVAFGWVALNLWLLYEAGAIGPR